MEKQEEKKILKLKIQSNMIIYEQEINIADVVTASSEKNERPLSQPF